MDLLNTTIYTLNNRTVIIVNDVGQLATITATSYKQIKSIARAITSLQVDTLTSFKVLLNRIYIELVPIISRPFIT
jgi:hypothetical protein